jgi:hypothetical protein
MGDQNRSQTPDHEAGTTSETPNLSTDNNKEINSLGSMDLGLKLAVEVFFCELK